VQFRATAGHFLAHWSGDNRVTLALECDCFWQNPLGADALGILIHEADHARNAHHGKSFHDEVERLGGVAAEIMFQHAEYVQRNWADLVRTASPAGAVRAKGEAWIKTLFRS
jgi:hypothetical protein